MAEPKLEVEQRLDRVEAAVRKMNEFLVDMPSDKTAKKCGEEIERILRGEDSEGRGDIGAG